MERKHKGFYFLLIVSALGIVCLVTFLYVRRLNKAISDNIISSISEIAEHDKATIQTFIEICWRDLYGIQDRLVSSDSRTIRETVAELNQERVSGGFSRLCLLAEDGTVYSDDYSIYIPSADKPEVRKYLLSCFAEGEETVVTRFDNKAAGRRQTAESILYGIRLDHLEIEGKKMLALIGISDLSSIQDNMVIDSFIRNGVARGHSALMDLSGDYIVNINKEIFQNRRNNLYEHLAESPDSELSNEELAVKIGNRETFGFYHAHEGERYRELFYLIPLAENFDLYFIMSVNEAVFKEQTSTLVTMSMVSLTVSMLTVIIMLLVVMRYQSKTIRASEKARSQKEFLSNMSHEIRTPLNGLIGMNHLIMVNIDDEGQRAQIKEWLQKSHSTANYLLSLVNDILDMSKLQAGKVELVKEPLLVEAMVDEIAAMQADNIRCRGVEFIVEKEISEPCVEGDEIRLKQILMNIVGNAAKFTPKGKYIKFSVSQEKTDDLHVTTIYRCEDTGIGISKEYIGKIFDSFSQEINRNTSGIKGTGLGMAISKLLANAMGGDITVESELDVGSVFTVAIPSVIVREIPDYLREGDRPDIPGDQGRSDSGEDARPVRILVAEDVELNAEILLEILAMEGFETAHASNGKEAVDMFEKSKVGEFDIILMDMQMPVMDGCAAAEKIRGLDREDAGKVLIYACTANTFQEDRDLALKSGMNDFLTKPIDVNVLLKKIGRGRRL